jgi:hypothetical protein
MAAETIDALLERQTMAAEINALGGGGRWRLR